MTTQRCTFAGLPAICTVEQLTGGLDLLARGALTKGNKKQQTVYVAQGIQPRRFANIQMTLIPAYGDLQAQIGQWQNALNSTAAQQLTLPMLGTFTVLVHGQYTIDLSQVRFGLAKITASFIESVAPQVIQATPASLNTAATVAQTSQSALYVAQSVPAVNQLQNEAGTTLLAQWTDIFTNALAATNGALAVVNSLQETLVAFVAAPQALLQSSAAFASSCDSLVALVQGLAAPDDSLLTASVAATATTPTTDAMEGSTAPQNIAYGDQLSRINDMFICVRMCWLATGLSYALQGGALSDELSAVVRLVLQYDAARLSYSFAAQAIQAAAMPQLVDTGAEPPRSITTNSPIGAYPLAAAATGSIDARDRILALNFGQPYFAMTGNLRVPQ